MRSLESASAIWHELQQYQSLPDLKSAVRLHGRSSAASTGLRSTCWKAFLLFDSMDTTSWNRTLLSSRSAYNSLRTHFLRHLDSTDEIAASIDPLGEDSESSHWAILRKDEELRAEILQDVERCMPENLYFRQPESQRMMLDILFVFCKLNPDVGYRQGMHELLAPILWVVERDAIDVGHASKALGESATMRVVFDGDHVEHDTFALFSQVMHNAKNFYEQTTHTSRDNPMVIRSRRIFNELLPQVDPELARHLESIEIVPQVFLMRWIRLLFGREFSFDDVLTMWDVIFAEDMTLELVDYICLAMLIRIRWELLDADYNAALTLLLRYPCPDATKGHPPQTFVLDAIYLRDHLDIDGSSYLILKHTGRSLQPVHRPNTPPALQRNMSAFSGATAVSVSSGTSSHSPSKRRPRQQRNIETMLQSTAKNIYARGEKLGIGKAVRNAVDEVHKKALEIRETQTASLHVSPRSTRTRDGPGTFYNRTQALQDRNKRLSKLLEDAVDQLWDYQKLVTDGSQDATLRNDSSEIEKLSVAIGKVQFVTVYLADSSLPLPETNEDADAVDTDVRTGLQDDKETQQDPQPEVQRDNSIAHVIPTNVKQPDSLEITYSDTLGVAKLADPSDFEENLPSFESPSADSNTAQTTAEPAEAEGKSPDPLLRGSESLANASGSNVSRPPLAESSFSWMLGPAESHSSLLSKPSPFVRERSRGNGFLFGDNNSAGDSPSGTTSKRTGGHRKQRASGTRTILERGDPGLDGTALDQT